MALIEFSKDGYVGTITINRPKEMNALNSEVLKELNDTLDAVDLDAVRCLIITGAGDRAFAAGADIGQMATATKEAGMEYSRFGNEVFQKIEEFPIPVIAAINGVALGGGCELSMSCDIRLASESALFGQPEVGLGITPGFGGTQRMARLIGEGKAKEYILTARNFKAPEALSVGLVQAVYPAEELMPQAQKMAKRIAENAPIAVRMSKRSINGSSQTDTPAGIDLEVEDFGTCFGTQDQREAMAAFIEKRKHEPFVNA
jgi:enoyl-CoA hydratase